jgi:transposase
MLSKDDQHTLSQLVNTGIHAARSIKRARILLLADAGHSDPDIAADVGVSLATVFNTRRRYCQAGLNAAVTEQPRRGAPPKLTGRQEAQVTAIACSDPPAGRQRWTMELLADRVVQLRIVDTISDSTIHRLLKKTT